MFRLLYPDGTCFTPQEHYYDLVPEWAYLDSGYQFEMSRYNGVATTDPNLYSGYNVSKPLERAKLMKALIGDRKEVVELGPGFGELLKILDVPSLAIEQSQGFLDYLETQQLNTVLVKGIAEELPLDNESVSCFVADGVFQSVMDREMFLYELGRVCEKGALIIFTIAHKWNYPRRPQNGFNINKLDEFIVLTRFMDELGFSCRYDWYNLEKDEFIPLSGFSNDLNNSDYLYVTGTKR